jgi:hypothetical protein
MLLLEWQRYDAESLYSSQFGEKALQAIANKFHMLSVYLAHVKGL